MGDLGAPLLGGLESSAAQELAALRIALHPLPRFPIDYPKGDRCELPSHGSYDAKNVVAQRDAAVEAIDTALEKWGQRVVFAGLSPAARVDFRVAALHCGAFQCERYTFGDVSKSAFHTRKPY